MSQRKAVVATLVALMLLTGVSLAPEAQACGPVARIVTAPFRAVGAVLSAGVHRRQSRRAARQEHRHAANCGHAASCSGHATACGG